MMNIDAGHIDTGHGSYAIRHKHTVRESSNPSGQHAKRAQADGHPVSDAAHTSLLARLASRELQQLHAQQDTIRPDKVAQFKHYASASAALPDSKIDTIMTRLLG